MADSEDPLSPTVIEAKGNGTNETKDYETRKSFDGTRYIKTLELPENDHNLDRVIMLYNPESNQFKTTLSFSGKNGTNLYDNGLDADVSMNVAGLTASVDSEKSPKLDGYVLNGKTYISATYDNEDPLSVLLELKLSKGLSETQFEAAKIMSDELHGNQASNPRFQAPSADNSVEFKPN